MGGDYKPTLNLPSTEFPMRANLSEREPDQVEAWDEQDIYEKMIARREEQGADRFIFHDGPPYANGHLHHGHILNKSLKDFIVKYRNMAGQLCEFVPGWDCHGLPIEHEVDEQLGDDKREMTTAEIRAECREYADKFVDIQRDEIRRILCFADWDNPYRTMSYDYEATILRMLGEFFDSGLVYRGLKPVHWDWDSRTALAEAEVEYQELRTEHVYVKFPFEEPPDRIAEAAGGRDVSVLIWTTTPWTLPANQAIALNPTLNYQLLDIDGDAVVMAEGRRGEVFDDCGIDFDDVEVLAEFAGRELVGDLGEDKGYVAEHPWMDRQSELLPASYVTLEQGTGCVHTAPGHGQEDFALGQQYGLDVLCPVDETGLFDQSVVIETGDGERQDLDGTHVLSANGPITEALDYWGVLLNEPNERITIDRYPFGWRSKKPVIFRATTQWFVAMEPESAGRASATQLRRDALDEIDNVDWVPAWGHDRISGMVEARPDWCISRQRLWGAPITVVYCDACDHALATRAIADHVADIVEEHGADVWFEWELDELLPDDTFCPECGGDAFTREDDILDVWFDSGVSWAAVLENRLGVESQADLYLEGSDQHRGWFQSSLLTGVLTRGHSPYETCVTHGFVTDEQGHKYSKSSENFEPPEEMLEEFGAEILRLWVASVDYSGDVALSDEVLDRIADAYRKIRNTFRFMLGNLSEFDPSERVAYEDLPEIDRWILHRAGEVVDRIEEAYENYEFHSVYHALVEFSTVDLSNIYMDVLKDRLYCEAPGDAGRRAGQTAYWLVLGALARAAAPILSFTAEEVWSHMPHGEEGAESVFLTDFPEVPDDWRDEALAGRWDRLLDVRREVQRALEEHRQSDDDDSIGGSQEAVVTLTADGRTFELLEEYADQLVELFIVSEVDLREGDVEGDAPVGVDVEASGREKCPRCWNYWKDPAADADICSRCQGVLEEL